MTNITFNDEYKYFQIKILENQYNFTYPLEVRKDFEEKDFEVYLFYKNNYAENDIFEVRLKEIGKTTKTRIGMFFPVNVLNSVSHEYADKQYFQNYAFMAYKHLIHFGELNHLYKDKRSGEYTLEDIFDENILVFILSKETLVSTSIEHFNINNFLPSFYLHGLVRYGFSNDDSYKHDLKSLPLEKKLVISEISKVLLDEEFISSVYHEKLPYENDYIVDFFYCYQIIELLMDKIFKNEMHSLITIINDDISSSRKIIDTLHDVREVISEKKRISKLENEYSFNSYTDESFKIECNKLLNKYDKDEGHILNEYFYSTRNFIFHELRSIENLEELKPLIIEFNYFVAHLVVNFKLTENSVTLEQEQEEVDSMEISRSEKIRKGFKSFYRSFVD